MTTNLQGDPEVANVPWNELSSVVDLGGENLSGGYAIDLPNQSNVGLTVNVLTYPNGIPPDAGDGPAGRDGVSRSTSWRRPRR